MSYKIFAIGMMMVVFAGCGGTKKPDPVAVPPPVSPEKPAVAQADATAKAAQPAPSKANRSEKEFECKNGSDVRKIVISRFKVEPPVAEERKCEVSYTKFDSSDIVAYAHHQIEFCEQIATNIRSNLEGGGFSCSER